jgi:hypothetical protein
MSYDIELYFAINETVSAADFDSIIKLDNIKYIKNKIDFIKTLTSKYKMDITFEDYDIEIDKITENKIAIQKNIGIVIENNIIDFIKEIKQKYSISSITNNNTDQIIFTKNINNFNKINIKTELDKKIYDLVNIN